MQPLQDSQIRDLSLAPQGQVKIAWADAHMPLLRQLRAQFERDRPFAGRRIAVCLHLEAKTANLALLLQAGGAEVAVAASNPLSTQDDVVAALVERGVTAFAWHGATVAEYEQHLQQLADVQPHALIDDGGDLVALLHRRGGPALAQVCGGCEETTTGVLRLRAMAAAGELRIPMLAVNDARCKHLFDNRYGTGQSVWDGIVRTTNLLVAGKTVVVVGYGWCGKGVAMRAKGLGARVIVCEVDPVRALEAVMEGFAVMPVAAAAEVGDFFVTVTGNRHSIPRAALERMKSGAVLANAGHFDVEIDKQALAELAVAVREVRSNITEYQLADGRRLYLLAEGRLVNLAAGDGHPVEVMDMSFALQALGLRWLVEHTLAPGVYPLPQELDEQVARMRLAAWGVSLDHLTEEQRRYLASWQ